MKSKLLWPFVAVMATSLFLGSCRKDLDEGPPVCHDGVTVTTSKVVASGFNNPRGLKFGPDGNLYVAEGGIGGTNVSTGCQQAPPPAGPYRGSNTGSRVSRVDWKGNRTTVADNLPSTSSGVETGSGVTGMADVGFIGDHLYALIGGAGCSHGVPDIPNGIIKVLPDEKWSLIADYSKFILANPGVNFNPNDYTPDGNPFSMVVVRNNFYVIEPNTGVLDKISLDGSVHRVVDISATQGHTIPTAVTFHQGYFYVGDLGTFPISGNSNIYKISPSGDIKIFATGFSSILSLVFDDHDRLYVLENTVGAPGPTPGLGDVVRLDPSGKREVVVSGLNLPTAITFGPDGKMYISNWGIGAPGMGEILQVTFKCEMVHGDKSD